MATRDFSGFRHIQRSGSTPSTPGSITSGIARSLTILIQPGDDADDASLDPVKIVIHHIIVLHDGIGQLQILLDIGIHRF